jgi:hypothetical protein
MKFVFFLFIFLLGFAPQKSQADDDLNYQQIISFSAGPFKPASAIISKGTYAFKYDEASTNSVLLEVGGATRLFKLGGTFYLNANLAYTRFNGSFSLASLTLIPTSSQNDAQNVSTDCICMGGVSNKLVYSLWRSRIHLYPL